MSSKENKGNIHFCNTSEAPRKTKSHSYTFYLDKIKELDIGREFAELKAYCTDGDIRPPYPYQWIATSTMLVGDDDPYEGIGESPLEALRNLYKSMKHAIEHPEGYEE